MGNSNARPSSRSTTYSSTNPYVRIGRDVAVEHLDVEELIQVTTTRPPTAALSAEDARPIGRELLELSGGEIEVLIGRLAWALVDHGVLDSKNGWNR